MDQLARHDLLVADHVARVRPRARSRAQLHGLGRSFQLPGDPVQLDATGKSDHSAGVQPEPDPAGVRPARSIVVGRRSTTRSRTASSRALAGHRTTRVRSAGFTATTARRRPISGTPRASRSPVRPARPSRGSIRTASRRTAPPRFSSSTATSDHIPLHAALPLAGIRRPSRRARSPRTSSTTTSGSTSGGTSASTTRSGTTRTTPTSRWTSSRRSAASSRSGRTT